MRILQVVSYYPPALSFGGPPQVMSDLGRELVSRGHSVSVYTTDVLTIENWKDRVKKKNEEMSGIKVVRFSRRKYGDKLPTKFLKLMVAGVDESQEAMDFDIVHISDITHPLGVKYSSWARKLNIPYVISIFGNLSRPRNLPRRVLRNSFDFLWGRRMLKNAAALLVQNPHEGELCTPYTSDGRIVPVLLPLDMASFQNLPPRGVFREKYHIKESEKMILFLGRIHEFKGIQLLVEASARLLNKLNCRLVIAGADEGYKESLVKRVKRLGIEERVIFTGPIFARDKLEAYLDADVFVTTPRIYEETSLAALEACACYTPVIVTERNAIPGLEEYKAGFQIHYDREELENILLRLLNNGDLREEMCQNARRLIEERYALDKVVDKLESLFLRVTEGP